MIKNYFLITLRSMMKNKFFIVINVLGMGVAIACCIVGYFVYDYDSSFDSVHTAKEKIYRVSAVREFENTSTKFGYVPLPLAEIVKQNFKDVDQSTRLFFSYSNFKREDDLFSSRLAYVDPDFFSMFTFEFLVGYAGGIQDRSSVLISDQMAIRLYGSPQEAFGKVITQVYGNSLKEIKIAGVFKEQPQNSSFYFREAYLNAENH